MATQSLLLPLLLVSVLLSPSVADPDPLQDFCIAVLSSTANPPANGFPCKAAAQVTSADFLFTGLSKAGSTANAFGSNVTAGNVLSFPGLNTLGLAVNRVDFAPGGLNPPHVHPRSSELVLVAKGRLLVGFVSGAGVFFSKVVKVGEVFAIPRGLMHFQYNVGKGKAVAITVFDSQLPGVVVAATSLFGSKPAIPSQVLEKAFQIDGQVVNTIKSKFKS